MATYKIYADHMYVVESVNMATLTVGADDTGTTFDGVLQDGLGQVALDKVGGDTLTLTGASTYSGGTTIEDGTLSVSTGGSIATPVTLAGGQISGGGTYGAVSVATTTTLTSSASDPSNPPPYGQPVTFTATIGPPNASYGTPTGSVDFYDETTETDSAVVQLTDNLDGTYSAALDVANLDVEDHYVTATYSGDSTFATSASDPYDQEVAPGTTSVTVPTSATYASGVVQLHATVSVASGQGTPTGSVEFFNGATTWRRHPRQRRSVEPDHFGRAARKPNDYGRLQRRRNFSGSQSTGGPVNIVGQTLSVSIGYVTSQCARHHLLLRGRPGDASRQRLESGRAAFTVTVAWGDGDPAEAFAFAGGNNSASVALTHLYNAGNGTRTIGVEVTPTDASDARQASATAPVTVYDPGPLVSTAGTPDSNGDGGYTFVATGFEPWDANAVLTYQWTTPELSSTQTSVTFTARS